MNGNAVVNQYFQNPAFCGQPPSGQPATESPFVVIGQVPSGEGAPGPVLNGPFPQWLPLAEPAPSVIAVLVNVYVWARESCRVQQQPLPRVTQLMSVRTGIRTKMVVILAPESLAIFYANVAS